jgi:hypothetical protein
MNTVARAQTTPVRSHAGWLWAALVLHALGTALVQFGSEYISIFESRLDWLLRLSGLAVLALGMIQLGVLLVRRVAGAEIAASMRQRMVMATLALGLLGAFFPNRDIPNLTLFGLLIGLAWRKWTRGPLLWLVAAAAASLLTNSLKHATTDLLRSLVGSLGFPGNYLLYAAGVGLLWSLLAGVAFAILITFAPGDALERWRQDAAELAELLPFRRVAARIGVGLALAGVLWVVYAQGMQGCRWLDRTLGRSGCVGTFASGGFSFDSTMAISDDGSTLLVTSLDEVEIFDVASRQLIQSWTLPPNSFSDGGAIAADGGQFAVATHQTGAEDLKVDIYRRGESLPFRTIPLVEAFKPTLGFAIDGRSLLIDDTIWDIASGAQLGRVDAASRAQYRTTNSMFNEYSPDGSLHTPDRGGRLRIYRARYDGSIGTLLSTIPAVPTGNVRRSAFSPDNSLLATAADENSLQVEIWRTGDASPVKTFTLSPQASADVEGLAFTPDNRYLLVARRFQDIEVYQLP